MVRTSPFHGGNMGSNPVGITNLKKLSVFGSFFFVCMEIESKGGFNSE